MTAPDAPTAMTLEEARQAYEKAAAELHRICQGPREKFRMRIPAQRDDSDLVLSDALRALKLLVEDERVKAALGRPVVPRDPTAELVEALKAVLDAVRLHFDALDPFIEAVRDHGSQDLLRIVEASGHRAAGRIRALKELVEQAEAALAAYEASRK